MEKGKSDKTAVVYTQTCDNLIISRGYGNRNELQWLTDPLARASLAIKVEQIRK